MTSIWNMKMFLVGWYEGRRGERSVLPCHQRGRRLFTNSSCMKCISRKSITFLHSRTELALACCMHTRIIVDTGGHFLPFKAPQGEEKWVEPGFDPLAPPPPTTNPSAAASGNVRAARAQQKVHPPFARLSWKPISLISFFVILKCLHELVFENVT